MVMPAYHSAVDVHISLWIFHILPLGSHLNLSDIVYSDTKIHIEVPQTLQYRKWFWNMRLVGNYPNPNISSINKSASFIPVTQYRVDSIWLIMSFWHDSFDPRMVEMETRLPGTAPEIVPWILHRKNANRAGAENMRPGSRCSYTNLLLLQNWSARRVKLGRAFDFPVLQVGLLGGLDYTSDFKQLIKLMAYFRIIMSRQLP